MRYIDHIRNMSEQPEITLWNLSMMRALSRGTNGATRTLMNILYKDYDYEMKLMDEEKQFENRIKQYLRQQDTWFVKYWGGIVANGS